MLKRKFSIALASAGLRQIDWARQNKISGPALNQVLTGKMTSKRITDKINSFIEDEFKKLFIVKNIKTKGESHAA